MMTSKQIQEQILSCERQVTSTYSNFHNEVRTMGERSINSANESKTKKTMLVFFIPVLIGVILFASNWFFGLICIIGGMVAAYNINKTAQLAEDMVINLQKNLNSQLENNKTI